mmetsp:Transcript_12666/g.31890  ORF Transcript_12666/g.31890 Transcript_12666/m.31890 type:complete len:210 (+) Transcript_12666:3492-4121(+)
MNQSNWVSGSGNTNSLEHTTVSKLFGETLSCQHFWFRQVIRLQASNIVRIGTFHIFDQSQQLRLKLHTNSLLSSGPFSCRSLGLLLFCFFLLNRITIPDQIRRSSLEKILCGNRDFVLILLHEACKGIVLHQTSEMPDAKEGFTLLDFRGVNSRVLRNSLPFFWEPLIEQTLAKVPVGTSWKTALIIQHGQNTCLLLLNSIQTVLVIGE